MEALKQISTILLYLIGLPVIAYLIGYTFINGMLEGFFKFFDKKQKENGTKKEK
jgi:hypothetical protein